MTTESRARSGRCRICLTCSMCRSTARSRSAPTPGCAGADDRQVVEGTQVLAQAIVAVAKRFPDKSVRSVHAVFSRAVMVGAPVELDIDVVHEGRSTATAVVTRDRRTASARITITVLADVPSDDVIRHHLPRPKVARAGRRERLADADDRSQLRLVDVVDVNSPDEVGPPELYAWLHYDPIPSARRPGQGAGRVLHRAPGHFDDDACARGHRHRAGAPDRVHRADDDHGVSFHEPFGWDGWLLYTHESTQVGGGHVLRARRGAHRGRPSSSRRSPRTR